MITKEKTKEKDVDDDKEEECRWWMMKKGKLRVCVFVIIFIIH